MMYNKFKPAYLVFLEIYGILLYIPHNARKQYPAVNPQPGGHVSNQSIVCHNALFTPKQTCMYL